MKKYLGKRFSTYSQAYDYGFTHIREAANAFAARETLPESAPRIAARITDHYRRGVDDLFDFDADDVLPEGYKALEEALHEWYCAQRKLVKAVEQYIGDFF